MTGVYKLMKIHATHWGRMRPRHLLLLLGLLALLGLAGCGSASSLSGPILAATVNGNGIGLGAYQSVMTFALRANAGTPTSWQDPSGRQTQASLQAAALNFLIDSELAREQTVACGVKVTPQDMSAQKKQLKNSGESVLKDPTDPNYATFRALLTTPNVLDYYGEQQAYEVALTKVLKLPSAHVAYILVSSKQQADSLLQQAKQGANFADLGNTAQSAANSTASYSDLGVQYIGEFLPEWDKAVFGGATTTKAGCYSNLKFNTSPQRFQEFTLTGQNAGQYMVVETTSVANAPLAAIGDAQTEGSVFNAWISEIVRLPGHSNVAKYPLPATADTSSSGA
jgi:PPIC-type PPIASE domain